MNFNSHGKHKSSSNRLALNVEQLEERMMLSTVSILASGSTGDEVLELRVEGTAVESWVVAETGSVFEFETEGTVTADQIQIAFTNDLYLPEQGIDRNLIVENLVIDGEVFQTDSSNVFSTGVWDSSANAVVSGFGNGDTLHTNGFFQYSSTVDKIDLQGRTWFVDQGSASSQNLNVNHDEVTLSGINGPLSISSEFDISQSNVYDFNVDWSREIISGQFNSDGQPWATAGVNFYDSHGSFTGQITIDLNSSGSFNDARQVIVPADSTSAFVWVWVDGYDEGVEIPLTIESIGLEPVDLSGDTTPPEASFTPFTFSESGQSAVQLAITFTDDTELLSQEADAIQVNGPNGFSQTAVTFGGIFEDFSDTRQTIIYGIFADDGEWDANEAGEYTVILNPNSVEDLAGNFAAGGVLGTFNVDVIPPPEDTVAPVVNLRTIPDVTSPPTGGRGSDIQFVVDYTDNQGLGTLESDRILVTGPNGYSGFGRGIAGGGLDGGFFEITFIPLPDDGVWSANENGTYTVSLVDNAVVDAAGNFAEGRELGSFLVDIDGPQVG